MMRAETSSRCCVGRCRSQLSQPGSVLRGFISRRVTKGCLHAAPVGSEATVSDPQPCLPVRAQATVTRLDPAELCRGSGVEATTLLSKRLVFHPSSITYQPRTAFGINWLVLMLFMLPVGGPGGFLGPVTEPFIGPV